MPSRFQRRMGARDPAEQNGNCSQRDPVPCDIILPLVQGTGAHLLQDTLKSNLPL